jgi:hypothetical protein
MATKTYRFNVSSDLNEKMLEFAILHKFEERKVLKENYENWLEQQEIKELIETEESLLRRSEYDLSKTSIQSKIFKSIKYYHIKNMLKDMQMSQNSNIIYSNARDTQENKNKNIVFSRKFIELVKNYLHDKISDPKFKPSSCFTEFRSDYTQEIEEEYGRIISKYQNNTEINDEILNFKLKKMFKNQYFALFKAVK